MAGAGFKTFASGEVLTAENVNTYLMQQTVMVFADSSARSTALGANVSEGMLSYLKDTNQIEVYNGSAWVAAAGGGMTLLSTTTLSGAETVISSISQDYVNLFVTVQNVTLDATGRTFFTVNATSNLTYVTTNNSASTTASSNAFQGNVGYLTFTPNMLNTGGNNSWSILFDNYTNTTSYKSFSFNGIYRDAGNTFDSGIMAGGAIEANSAISSLTFTHNVSSFNGGTVKIYGVK